MSYPYKMINILVPKILYIGFHKPTLIYISDSEIIEKDYKKYCIYKTYVIIRIYLL